MMHTRPFLKMAIALVIASLPATALAQNSISLTQPSGLSNVGTTSATINLEDCEANYDKNLNFSITFDSLDAGEQYVLYRVPDGATCPTKYEDSPSGDCETLETDNVVPTAGTYDYDTKTLAQFVDDMPCSALTGTNWVFRVVVDTTLDEAGSSFNYTLNFATEAPDNVVTGAPTLSAGQSTIKVSFEHGDVGDGSFKAYYSTTDPGDGTRASEWTGAKAVANFDSGDTLENLTTNRTYYVAITTISDEGNESDLSAVTSAETTPTNDFFELYEQGGGQDGCESSQAGSPRGTALWVLALLGGLLLATRSRKAALAAGVLAVAVALPTVADAQAKSYEDSKGLVEVRLGSYLPEVDDAVDNSPYNTAFGESMFLFELELDRQLWRGIGTLGVSFNGGYMSVDGKSQTSADGSGGDSPDKTSLSIMPLRAGLVYRFDYLAQRFDIPFTLALKGGADMYVWWVKAGDNLANANGKTGQGVTLGYHYAAGLHLLLDWFDEHSADGLALDFGVINSYLFAEVQRAEVDDFGDAKSIRLSDTHYSFGLAFEY